MGRTIETAESGLDAGVDVAELGAHRAIVDASAFLTLVWIYEVFLADMVDGPVRALGLACPAGVAQVKNDFVGHDALLGASGVCVPDVVVPLKMEGLNFARNPGKGQIAVPQLLNAV